MHVKFDGRDRDRASKELASLVKMVDDVHRLVPFAFNYDDEWQLWWFDPGYKKQPKRWLHLDRNKKLVQVDTAVV